MSICQPPFKAHRTVLCVFLNQHSISRVVLPAIKERECMTVSKSFIRNQDLKSFNYRHANSIIRVSFVTVFKDHLRPSVLRTSIDRI
jgi:hypothetical protein